MEQLENMAKIEAAQTELGQFLISMMPVPWTKICYYARVAPGFSSPWFGFIEKETDVICCSEFFWNRYDTYPFERREAHRKLHQLVSELYNAYLERFGEEKIWSLIYYTINDDGKVHIDFEYEKLPGNPLEQQREVFRRFFGSEYKYYWTKYPSTEKGQG